MVKKILKSEFTHIVTAITVIASFMHFVYQNKIDVIQEKHEIERNELKIKIASVERNIGENRYFDVRTLFQENNSEAPYESHFLQKGNFYADTTLQGWLYKSVSPISGFGNEFKIDPIEINLGRVYSPIIDTIFRYREFKDYLRNYRFHKWTKANADSVEGEAQTSSLSVFVIKKSVADLIFQELNENVESEKFLFSLIGLDEESLKEIILNAKKQFNKSSSGLIFSLFIHGKVYSALGNGEIITLEVVEKKKNVFYSQYSKEIHSDDKKVLYETGELIFAERNNNLYIVAVQMFSKEPLLNKIESADVNNWLFSLKFL